MHTKVGWDRGAVAEMEGEVNLSSSTGKKQPEGWSCLSGLGWSSASSLTPEGKAVPAVPVLPVLGTHAGKLQELLKAMSINHRLCESTRGELKREISNKSKTCQSVWQSLELTCES